MTRFNVSPPRPEEANPYLPPGPPEPLVFEQFDGMNTQPTRPGVDDKQAYWLDGFMPIAPRNLRTLWGVGDPIEFSDSAAISFFAFANIGATPYCIVIHVDGSIHAVNTETYASSEIAAAGTIQSPSRLNVDVSQYGSRYVMIVSTQTNGYFIWDGTTFYEPGDSAPGGGTMPSGISGNAIEIYTGRVWIANGATLTFSAPGSITDFTTGSGGGNITSSDSFLRVRYVRLIQTNGFLYLLADSSINYISGVQTSGTPPTTTFTNQNADPEVGTPWPSSVTTLGRNIIFANAFGAQGSYGAAVNKISEALDGVYNTVPNFGGLIPSAAKAIVFGKRVWILLLPIIDPVTGQQVNKLFMWDSKRWWASAQDVPLVYIQYQEIDSVLTAWGSTGAAIYPLFQQPSTAFTKIAQSKLWDRPGSYLFNKTNTRLWGLAQYFSALSPDLTISIDNEFGQSSEQVALTPNEMTWTNNVGQTMVWTNNVGSTMTWFALGAGVVVMAPQAVGQQGVLAGFTVETTAADMALISLAMDSKIAQYRG